MKLYATIKNTKGKRDGVGDNEYIHIDLSRGNKYEYLIYYTLGGLTISKIGNGIVYQEQKGKSQKGEIVLCKRCNYIQAVNLNKEGYCEDCWRDIKHNN
ncbi:MAG TPA: hypothetical protein VK675_03575 [Candidatus Paceibacterota bacterium]|nr:hypothetical protein [Candidatus Paceibacterota bacterium]